MRYLILVFTLCVPTMSNSQNILPDEFWLKCAGGGFLAKISRTEKTWELKIPAVQNLELCEDDDVIYGGIIRCRRDSQYFNKWSGKLVSGVRKHDCSILDADQKPLFK